jgi:hypothetical protein
MQNGEVGWDPISIGYQPPWAIRLLVIYCAIVLIIAVVKALKLASLLWFFPDRKLAVWKSASEQAAPSLVARAGFSRNFRTILTSEIRHNLLSPLVQAEADFLYLWQLYMGRVKSIKRLAALTLLISVWVFLMRSIDNFSFFGAQKISSFNLISGTMVENLTCLEAGTLVFIVLYTQYALLEAALRRRKAAWGYIAATAKRSD